jgi:YjbE family integral membrane protein
MNYNGGTAMADPVSFLYGVLSIILIDLVLSGDNAVLIALACRNLPRKVQKKGIILGTLGAVLLRILLAVFVLNLLERVPFLKLIGGLLLIWIAVKLVVQEAEDEYDVHASERLWTAVKTIIVADAVMSVDNILAVAGAAQGRAILLWFGLALSIPLVVSGSQLLLALINRFPWIIQLGAAVLGWTAGHMLITDGKIVQALGGLLQSPYMLNGYLVPAAGALGVVLAGILLRYRKAY